jgi:hypothetical protein
LKALFALGLTCALAAPAAARGRRCHGDCAPLGATVEVSLGVAELSLANQTFSDAFTPVDANHHPLPAETVSVRGRNLGALHPCVLVYEAHPSFMWIPHFALGAKLGVLFGNLGKPVAASDGALVNPDGAVGLVVGPEAQTVFSHGPFELRGGLALGVREEWLAIPNRIVRCKNGYCPANISAGQFFLEPRVSVAVSLGAFRIGAYAGDDVMPTGGWSTGGFMALRIGDWRALSDSRVYSTRGLYH